jgi:uncharacterized protein (DUF924 family)
MADPARILDFWFGPDPGEKRAEWFAGGPAFDDLCRQFEPDWRRAAAGALADWLATPEGLLAFVVLTDQIPRNIFREDPRAFATDRAALSAAGLAVRRGWDTAMTLHERAFLYLPFEHAEDMAAQDESVRLYSALGDPEYLKFAEAHRDIIARFGRFPHRNAALRRLSTPAEIAFAETKGRGF